MSGYQDYDAPQTPDAQVYKRKAIVKEHSTYMTDRDAEKMCQLFADGLDSGIGYARVFDFMERQKLDGRMIARLRESVLEDGAQLGEAFTRFGILDSLTRKLILVSEEQGTLPNTFRQQAKGFAARWKRRKQFVFAFPEPVILGCLGGLILPQIYGNLQVIAFAPDMIPVLIDLLGKGAIESMLVMLFISICGYFWVHAPVDSTFRTSMERIWFRVPIFSRGSRLNTIVNFTRYLQQSVVAGMDIFRSVELAAEASNNPTILRHVDPALDALEAGYPLDQALSIMKGLPDDVLDYIGIGEETGKLDENLDFITKRYEVLTEEEFERFQAALIWISRVILVISVVVFALFRGVLGNIGNLIP